MLSLYCNSRAFPWMNQHCCTTMTLRPNDPQLTNDNPGILPLSGATDPACASTSCSSKAIAIAAILGAYCHTAQYHPPAPAPARLRRDNLFMDVHLFPSGSGRDQVWQDQDLAGMSVIGQTTLVTTRNCLTGNACTRSGMISKLHRAEIRQGLIRH